jgi:hypothetical protein
MAVRMKAGKMHSIQPRKVRQSQEATKRIRRGSRDKQARAQVVRKKVEMIMAKSVNRRWDGRMPRGGVLGELGAGRDENSGALSIVAGMMSE